MDPGEGMTRLNHGAFLAILLAALLSWACDDPVDLPTQPSGSAPETTTETFSGNLTVNGARTFPFSSLAGTVTATLTSLGPDSQVAVGFSLGTWSGSVCNIVLANDNAVQGTVVVGTAGTLGSLCVRIYDVGNLTGTLPFELTVEHP
jgi:hypothetical protein